MKICPKCQAENKDENRTCANCQAHLGPETIRPDDGRTEARLHNAQKRMRRRNLLVGTLFFGFFAVSFGYFSLILFQETGSIVPALAFLPLYIPPVALFLLPYDRIYRFLRGKRGLPERPVPDLAVMLFRALGAVLLLVLFGLTFSCFGQYIAAVHGSNS